MSSPQPPSTSISLVDNLLAGNRRALARAITLIENDGAGAHSALAALYRRTGFVEVPRFGAYVDSPLSLCMAKAL